MYYIYMLRCEDNSIYTGIAKDLEHRLNEHFTKDEKCAKYTKSHKAKKLEIAWKTENTPNLLGEFLKDKIDETQYCIYK